MTQKVKGLYSIVPCGTQTYGTALVSFHYHLLGSAMQKILIRFKVLSLTRSLMLELQMVARAGSNKGPCM